MIKEEYLDLDQLDEIMKKSVELGKLIALSTVYKEFKVAENDLLHNSGACKIVEELQKMKSEHQGKKMAGIEISKVDQEMLQKLEDTCLKDQQVLISNNANTKFQQLMEKMSGNIKMGIKSIDQG